MLKAMQLLVVRLCLVAGCIPGMGSLGLFFWAGGNSAMQMIMVSWLISDMDNHHSMWGGLPANQMGWDSDTIHYPFEKMQYWGIPSWKGILL